MSWPIISPLSHCNSEKLITEMLVQSSYQNLLGANPIFFLGKSQTLTAPFIIMVGNRWTCSSVYSSLPGIWGSGVSCYRQVPPSEPEGNAKSKLSIEPSRQPTTIVSFPIFLSTLLIHLLKPKWSVNSTAWKIYKQEGPTFHSLSFLVPKQSTFLSLNSHLPRPSWSLISSLYTFMSLIRTPHSRPAGSTRYP